jgi:hypothetical protein
VSLGAVAVVFLGNSCKPLESLEEFDSASLSSFTTAFSGCLCLFLDDCFCLCILPIFYCYSVNAL